MSSHWMAWARGLRGADRGDAAGRDAEIPRATERGRRATDRKQELVGRRGPAAIAGRIAATPRGATRRFRGQPNADEERRAADD